MSDRKGKFTSESVVPKTDLKMSMPPVSSPKAQINRDIEYQALCDAAPDLYDALSKCLKYLERTEEFFNMNIKVANQARAALTKARGE